MTTPEKKTAGIANSIAQSWNKDRLPVILLAALFAGVIVVFWGAVFSPGYRLAAALIWGFGFCVSGMLLGFLFAIPRTLPSGTVNVSSSTSNGNAPKPQQGVNVQLEADPKKSDSAAGAGRDQITFSNSAAHGPSRNEINSNLVEVSDWLTKIIVGRAGRTEKPASWRGECR